jgi:hypothetical protein
MVYNDFCRESLETVDEYQEHAIQNLKLVKVALMLLNGQMGEQSLF